MPIKKVSLIAIIGLLLTLAGLRVFAAETAIEQLNDKSLWNSSSSDVVNAEPQARKTTVPPPVPATPVDPSVIPAPSPDPAAVVVSTSPAPTPPAPKPNPVKEFLTDHKAEILLGGLGAFVGFALGGPVGMVLGCLFMLGFLWLANS